MEGLTLKFQEPDGRGNLTAAHSLGTWWLIKSITLKEGVIPTCDTIKLHSHRTPISMLWNHSFRVKISLNVLPRPQPGQKWTRRSRTELRRLGYASLTSCVEILLQTLASIVSPPCEKHQKGQHATQVEIKASK